MSRVGRKPILIPENVQVKLEQDQKILIKGPRGELSLKIPREIKAEIQEGKVLFSLREESTKKKLITRENKKRKSLWGLLRNIVFNQIEGVIKGYEKKLEIEGLGYRAEIKDGNLVLYVGYIHPVTVKRIEGVNFSIEKNIITVSGIDKRLVGQTAAKIRQVRPPDPYKAKGIRYLGEKIRKKAGKKAAGAVTK